MSGNYPDGLSDTTPGAPWNQGDPAPLVCDDCHEVQPSDSEEGDSCPECGSPNLREQSACPNCGRPETGCVCDD